MPSFDRSPPRKRIRSPYSPDRGYGYYKPDSKQRDEKYYRRKAESPAGKHSPERFVRREINNHRERNSSPTKNQYFYNNTSRRDKSPNRRNYSRHSPDRYTGLRNINVADKSVAGIVSPKQKLLREVKISHSPRDGSISPTQKFLKDVNKTASSCDSQGRSVSSKQMFSREEKCSYSSRDKSPIPKQKLTPCYNSRNQEESFYKKQSSKILERSGLLEGINKNHNDPCHGIKSSVCLSPKGKSNDSSSSSSSIGISTSKSKSPNMGYFSKSSSNKRFNSIDPGMEIINREHIEEKDLHSLRYSCPSRASDKIHMDNSEFFIPKNPKDSFDDLDGKVKIECSQIISNVDNVFIKTENELILCDPAIYTADGDKEFQSENREVVNCNNITDSTSNKHNNLQMCYDYLPDTKVEPTLVETRDESSDYLKNTTIVTKLGPDSDSITMNSVSKSNEMITTAGEEISEESRLIQSNPALREFDLLDEFVENENEGGEDQQSNSSEFASDSGEELPLDDVDAMLEEGLPEKFRETGNKERVKLRRKVILEEIGYNHFDMLPEGWIQIMHSSGMPVYLHQKSRVCTMARPYYLGPGSSRNHKVPLSAIPCLQYKRALEVEKNNKEQNGRSLDHSRPEIRLMPAKIETYEENEAAQSLEALDLRNYCKNLFSFKTITFIPFKSWADRRKYVRMTKDLKKRQRPSLPGGTKLLKFPIQNPDGTSSRSKGEWIINPNGKSYVCILHEYVQHALKEHPKYEFKELENPATPYSATVFIGEMQYSIGMGASKKQAKVEAAKAALEVLIPEMKDKIERDCHVSMRTGIARSQTNDISIFDQIKVEDPRVAEFCAKTTEPPPYAILLTCLSRNLGLGDIKVHYEMNSKKHKEDEFTMTVGNHTATVVCKSKRDGKQRAAQAILQMLHPNITHWGSLLRMYGNRSIKSVKEKKQEEQEITGLQSKASLNQPNYAILDKLRTEMRKLKEKREAVKAKGKFTPPENILLPSLSSTDLNKVNLS